MEFYDDENSEWEDRFLLLGISARLRLLMMCHCYRADDSVIRIISARKARPKMNPIITKGDIRLDAPLVGIVVRATRKVHIPSEIGVF
jgi:hypothetical protein